MWTVLSLCLTLTGEPWTIPSLVSLKELIHVHRYQSTSAMIGNLTEEQLARASHSSLVWGDYVIVYGGYRFPTAVDGPVGSGSGSGDTGERGEEVTGPQLLRYHISSGVWTELEVNQSSPHPAPRYGHSAVLYNVRPLPEHPSTCTFIAHTRLPSHLWP